MLVLWCPDWPVVAAGAAAGLPAHLPAAVFAANRVVACSAIARAAGVRRDMRRREAQSRCPELAVFAEDPDRDARLFEPVVAAVEQLVVGVEAVRPGLVAVPVSGAAGYFGGEDTLVELLVDHVSGETGVECQIGVSDGLFAATLAAHRSLLVEAGTGASFLASLSVTELDQPGSERAELVDLLRRLGLRTLGAFAALSERDVVARFGSVGVLAHRLANGQDERPPHRRRPPPELFVTETFDPPLERIDVAAFMAKTLAGRFHSGLAARGLACTRLGIYATTERGEELSRVWRCAEPLTPEGIADRVRWQFEGWLRAGDGQRPTAGVSELRLEPGETVEGRSLQLGLWQGGDGGEHTPEADRAARALVHVQGLLGPDSVFTAVVEGGRGPAERFRLVPWGDQRTPSEGHDAPWPEQLPAPSPATVFEERVPVVVSGAAGVEVSVTDRHRLTGRPQRVAIDGGAPRRVLGWAGPWPVLARWWMPEAKTRVRMQVVLEGMSGSRSDIALLLEWQAKRSPLWTVEGMYD
ncbi:DNA polymerase Y family protein [Prauserella sp. ASG 168]|uniref:DNA polymerase Y family protein n=1 Tax=Prauserella cavernicola TaxID=2800127 RepID=A0A934QZ86_9PSEU|nr:DNA polymerase Y family protein [Prauserella cavernicola]MBK1789286.1 DNA polymerase Y family protein [Prauserella cavernicola]